MKLLIIRHAIAEDREEFAKSGKPDEQRPLTRAGRRKMKEAAKGLRRAVRTIDHLATSPLVRAAQTAEIVSDTWGIGGAEVIPALAPEARPEALAEWAAAHTGHDVVAVVGHEPHLSSLATWLLSGQSDSRIDMKKGGACLIDMGSELRPGSGTLLWLVTPRLLRRLAR
jgi:phosphohistidine phosphatase